ncbi:hypothetical protein [Streptantibioticus silvisoli]|uniref:Uncharacterized protein n=1 Tax=Streptantibioticus silvisoli TaxID=2705255 RepID=A0ABT6W2D6_9ACTN|nr:hypothetical protein [Streptantibioticus silvisoli]MDI5964839.1 hypothetical protein [Streptantibioticus silvisoli]
MTTYQPGVYAFNIVVSDPQRQCLELEVSSYITVDRVMDHDQVAQVIIDAISAQAPDVPVLHLAPPTYRLQLVRR